MRPSGNPPTDENEQAIARLLSIMARLRDPDGGCPWDLEQRFETIVPHTIEEAYEVADAIERGARDELRDELGDLLFQVVFYAQLAQEEGSFSFREVALGICEKMERRHPHVFGDAQISGVAEQSEAWERQKAGERRSRQSDCVPSEMDGVARTLPALVRAAKLQRRAAKVGFDWHSLAGPLAKIQEELGELSTELAGNAETGRLEEEMGDLLFSCVNLARHLGVEAETALRAANGKFEKRFRAMELASATRDLKSMSLDELELLWERAKREVAE
ncbi:MAG: nucleoside triphosphate pyrophosphohydrolase [Gammaproteobacteria bacterium]|nr:nucleoside triphosphate pyrophosphohydrolase [Gammaproteobacteria bacterium]